MIMVTPRISKRDHHAQRRYNARSTNNQGADLFKRQGIIDNLRDRCKKHPNPLCLLLPPPPKPPNPPRTTSTPQNPPAASTKAPTPSPTPAPSPAPTPKPSQAPSVVNPPAASSNANPGPNATRGTSQGTQVTSSYINISPTVTPTGASTLSSSGTSGPLPTNSDPTDTLTTDRGGPSDQSTANPQGGVPFGTDPSSTIGVGNNDKPLPGNTGIANTSASAAGANAGPIIGGILGAVFLVLIILAALVWFRQKRNRATRVAPSSEFMGGNRQYPFAGGIQGQQARLSNPETRSMGNSSSSAQNIYDIRRGV